MSFHDVQLPEHIERGAQGGPTFSTRVVTLKNGIEYRNADWARARHRWDLGYGIQELADLQEVLEFFYARQGRLHSFRFKDWSDYLATDQLIGVGNGSQNEFQLVRVYSSGPSQYTRTVTKPVAGTVTVKGDGLPLAVIGTDTLTGIVTLAGAPPLGIQITASFEFDIPVRFDVDSIPINIQTFNAGTITSLPVIEVLE